MRRLSSFIAYAVLVSAVLALGGCASAQVSSQKTKRYQQIGLASYYAHKFHGRATASGEIYDMYKFTAAHPQLPFGTLVKVTNLKNKKSVILKVNDRGPVSKKRIIDVSYKAAQELGFVREGLVKVRLEIVKAN
ncbi:MAG: hypothetical protein RBG1_1C00001G0193 [candidate division Zixibacteria bacterium RBG-1]|nr:MAG: hypothetical protein RBG1_1C00001G0193 [candidate division Zixibacteria bacterium RBG-1]